MMQVTRCDSTFERSSLCFARAISRRSVHHGPLLPGSSADWIIKDVESAYRGPIFYAPPVYIAANRVARERNRVSAADGGEAILCDREYPPPWSRRRCTGTIGVDIRQQATYADVGDRHHEMERPEASTARSPLPPPRGERPG